MLPKEEREKKISYSAHTIQSLAERKKKYFPYCSLTKEVFRECLDAMRDPNKGVIFEDGRQDTDSTHYLMFVNEAGYVVALPIAVNSYNVHWFTIKGVKEDWENPNWFINNYNAIASTRGMDKLPLVIRN